MLACIASGVVLPVMDIIFGKFINVFNDFYTGQLSPEGYRTQVGKYRYVYEVAAGFPSPCQSTYSTVTTSLFFVYLFVAKFVLQYIWTVWQSSSPSTLQYLPRLICAMAYLGLILHYGHSYH